MPVLTVLNQPSVAGVARCSAFITVQQWGVDGAEERPLSGFGCTGDNMITELLCSFLFTAFFENQENPPYPGIHPKKKKNVRKNR